MPKKKKRKKFSAVTALKAAAREQVGAPPATRRVEDSRAPKQEKHKPNLAKLLAEE